MATTLNGLKSPDATRAFRLAVLANILWGTSFLASKYTLAVWSPLSATLIRFGLAIIVMLIVFPRIGFPISLPRDRHARRSIFAVGLSGFGILYPLQLSGMSYIPSGASSAIMLTSPLFVVLGAAIFLGERISRQKLSAIGFGIAGGWLLLWDHFVVSGNFMRGALLTLLASISLAASVITTRRWNSSLDSQTLTFWSMLIGLLVIFPFWAASGDEVTIVIRPGDLALAIGSVVYLAAICSAACFLMWNKAIGMVPARDLASSMHIKTPVAILMGVLIGHEVLSGKLVIGTLIVGFGVWLSQAELKGLRKQGRHA